MITEVTTDDKIPAPEPFTGSGAGCYSKRMTKFIVGDIIRRNGSKVASTNTVIIRQIHVTESGRLIKYVGWNEAAECPIAIFAKDAAYWHKVTD